MHLSCKYSVWIAGSRFFLKKSNKVSQLIQRVWAATNLKPMSTSIFYQGQTEPRWSSLGNEGFITTRPSRPNTRASRARNRTKTFHGKATASRLNSFTHESNQVLLCNSSCLCMTLIMLYLMNPWWPLNSHDTPGTTLFQRLGKEMERGGKKIQVVAKNWDRTGIIDHRVSSLYFWTIDCFLWYNLCTIDVYDGKPTTIAYKSETHWPYCTIWMKVNFGYLPLGVWQHVTYLDGATCIDVYIILYPHMLYLHFQKTVHLSAPTANKFFTLNNGSFKGPWDVGRS